MAYSGYYIQSVTKLNVLIKMVKVLQVVERCPEKV